MDLPWHEEKIKTVPSNFPVALKVLETTNKYFESKNLIKKYNDVFNQQESEGIIERLKVNLHNIATYPKLKPIIPFERFSKLAKLIKATAFVFKFIDKCEHNKDCLESYHRAKLYLFKVMREQTFFKEIAYIKNPKENKIPDLVRSLNLFLDSDGLLTTDGRIANTSGYEYGLIYPISIAKYHSLTELLINDCHHKCKHLGINATVNKLRMSGFGVPQARQAVKSIISKCFTCKKFNNLAFRYPKLTNLPKHRVNFYKRAFMG